MNKRVVVMSMIVLSVLVLGFISATNCSTSRCPVLGKDMIDPVFIVEDHRDVLVSWVDQGIRDATLINVDAHDDLRKIPPESIQPLLRWATPGFRRVPGREVPAGNSNFITAAIRLGIVSKVLWVVPGSYDLFSGNADRLKKLLRAYSFTSAEISTFRMGKEGFIGKVEGIPVVVTDPSHLPRISEPVLLTIDVDFFPAMVEDGRESPITEVVRSTLGAIFARGYGIRHASVAYSVNGEFLKTSYRWVGDLVIHALRQPAIMAATDLPDRYYFMQKADLLHVMGRTGELLDHLRPFLTGDGTDPAAYLYAALAERGRGDDQKAYRYAEKACQTDRSYCYGLPELGKSMLAEKGLDFAERFFSRGYELCPDMDHGQFALAMSLRERGRYDEAIGYFKEFRSCYGPFPVDLYIAETLGLKGDRQGAKGYYDNIRREMVVNPYSMDGFGDAGALLKAAAFYEGNGEPASAAEIRRYLVR